MTGKTIIKKALRRKLRYVYWVSLDGDLMMQGLADKGGTVYKKDLREARDYFIDNAKFVMVEGLEADEQ